MEVAGATFLIGQRLFVFGRVSSWLFSSYRKLTALFPFFNVAT
jgi:hypothetical protein